jgi:hypothetical protein
MSICLHDKGTRIVVFIPSYLEICGLNPLKTWFPCTRPVVPNIYIWAIFWKINVIFYYVELGSWHVPYLFIYGLCNDTVSSNYGFSCWIMKWYGREQLWPNLRYYPSMSGETGKSHENPQDKLFLGQDFYTILYFFIRTSFSF